MSFPNVLFHSKIVQLKAPTQPVIRIIQLSPPIVIQVLRFHTAKQDIGQIHKTFKT